MLNKKRDFGYNYNSDLSYQKVMHIHVYVFHLNEQLKTSSISIRSDIFFWGGGHFINAELRARWVPDHAQMRVNLYIHRYSIWCFCKKSTCFIPYKLGSVKLPWFKYNKLSLFNHVRNFILKKWFRFVLYIRFNMLPFDLRIRMVWPMHYEY